MLEDLKWIYSMFLFELVENLLAGSDLSDFGSFDQVMLAAAGHIIIFSIALFDVFIYQAFLMLSILI